MNSFKCWNPNSFNICRTLVRLISSEVGETIVIPHRIKRSPTDILKALAGTVTRDSNAPHYKYHDDPFLIPTSNMGRRTYAMAKESGRKAARWVQTEHADLFTHEVAKPYIKKFAPKVVLNENSVVDENTLKTVIKSAEVSDAINIYELLEKQGVDISHSTKQSLLELLCFFNCESPVPEDLLEERWFMQGIKGKERQRKTWRDNSLAEKLFFSLENKDSAAYSALIRGMARYYQVDRAWQLYEESQDKNIVLGTETYNSLIQCVHFLRESTELRWKLIQDLLNSMAKQNLQPNIGTLNSVLEAISTMPNQKQSKGYALRTIAEFKKLNIKPSLASYYYLLITFCKDRGPVSDILTEIINHIQDQEFQIQDFKDTYFFVTAMDICRNHLQDKGLGYRVDKLLHLGNNYVLIGDSYKESIYYRHFLMLLCATETLEEFMKMYHKLIPHIYIPEPAVMEEVIKMLDINGAVEYLPQIWSDMVVFDHVERENTIGALLTCMVRHQPDGESDLIASFGNIAWDAWSRIEDVDQDRYRKWSWSGEMLGNIMTLSLRAGNFENACVIMTKLIEGQQNIVGLPPVSVLQLFLTHCIENKNIRKAVACVEYCAEGGFPEVEQMAIQLVKELEPSSEVVNKLSNIISKDLSDC